jgi:hypothetical protein
LKLGKNSNNIELLILENNKEIQNSFNSVLSLPLSLAKQDLFFIDKHIELIEGEFNMNISHNFFNDFNYNLEEESCLIKYFSLNIRIFSYKKRAGMSKDIFDKNNGSEIIKSDISVSYTKIKDKKNPLFTHVNESLNINNDI